MMSEKTIYIHTTSTDQFEFDNIGDALNYIEELIETMGSEQMIIYVMERDE